jgi:type IV pilus assembly protein PilM
MANPKAAWGMEIGAAAIKAIRLEREGDRVRVTDFAVVPHKKVLSTPDVDQDELTRLSLGQFISQNALEGEHLVVSVPGHAAFARFAKLPPVEPKKVPDIVKFEAVQQIPFPIDQVEWDYETFTSDDSPEVEVGIFAITRDRVQKRLSLLAELGIAPAALNLSPVAVYNAMVYDHELSKRKGAVVYLDIGTNATDVVVAESGRCWIRTFPLGGTHFTEAIAKAFKLSYAKAERLKQEAATSKYAKQIMQAMRPVFSDLLQDLQRSIGYYQTLHRDTELDLMVGLGATFKIPGLRKFLGQQLQIQVLRLDEYKKLRVAGREASAFAQATVGLATAYGCALQGVGLSRIDANLVPVDSLRADLWHHKTKWFAGAAAILTIGAFCSLIRPVTDGGAMADRPPPVVNDVLGTAEDLQREYEDLNKQANVGFKAENLRRLTDYRRVWPHLMHDSAAALAAAGPQPELFGADVEQIKAVDPAKRRLVELEHLEGAYFYDPETRSRRIAVTMNVALTHDRATEFLNDTVGKWLRDNAERPDMPYRIIVETISCNPDKLEAFTVKGDGTEEAAGRPSAPSGSRPPTPGRREREGSGIRPPGPPQGSSGAGAGGFGVSGGAGMGKRDRPTGTRRPPGPGGSGAVGGSSQSPGGGFLPRGERPGGSKPSSRGTGATGGTGHKSLDALGPLPTRPSIYPAGAKVSRVPVTFQIELIDEAFGPVAAQAALERSLQEPAS